MRSEALIQLRNDVRLPLGKISRKDVLTRLSGKFQVKGQIVHAADVQSKVFIGFQQMSHIRPTVEVIDR